MIRLRRGKRLMAKRLENKMQKDSCLQFLLALEKEGVRIMIRPR